MKAKTEERARLYRAVRGGLLLKGMTLTEWAKSQGVTRPYVLRCLGGDSTGPAAREMVHRVMTAAGIDCAGEAP